MNKIIKVHNLKKTYYTLEKETLAIDDINFEVNDNEIIAIVGPSGCGKSTLLNIIGELDEATEGTIEYKKNIEIGYMFQSDCLFPWLKIMDNCLLGLKIKKRLNKDNINYVNELLNKYNLDTFINSYPNNLSGGMRQRVG